MWQRVLTIALCGPIAIWANVCSGLPTAPPERADFTGTPHPVSYQLAVIPGGPAFKITIRPLLLKWQENNDPVHAGDIEVAACEDGKQLQSLPLTAWQPIDFGVTYKARDINFDGYRDISVLTEFAGKWGSEAFWVYDPLSGRFVQNAFTRELSENCLGTEWHGGCWKANFIEFDSAKREIRVHYLVGVGDCGSPVDRYRVQDNRLIVVHKEDLKMDPDQCTLSISDLIGGSMGLTNVRRFDGRGRPLK
jgi:hypothetical protein